jgi:hypothetical protein
MINLEQLIDWLGTSGAIAGLVKSDLTVQEIVELTSSSKPPGFAKMKREEVVEWLVLSRRREMTKSPDELMQMDSEALRMYFSRLKFSREEFLELLATLDIRPGSVARKNLAEFAAREISDIGMYKRVAKGKGSLHDESIEQGQHPEIFRIRYRVEGQKEYKELTFKPESGRASDRDVAIAIIDKEFPSASFPSSKKAELVLRDHGISEVTWGPKE